MNFEGLGFFFDYKDIDMSKMLISFCLSSVKFTSFINIYTIFFILFLQLICSFLRNT